MDKKGQAAMEFLMTYGWAILAAVVAIGVLAYFGVFSPGRYISKSCIINAPLGCEESTIGTDLQLVIRNGGGTAITISSIAVDNCTTNTDSTPIPDGDVSSAITITCDLASGDKVKKDIVINYTISGGVLVQQTTGTISGRVP